MAGLVPGQSPGDVVQLGLIVREVREGNAGQQIVDPLLQHSPDGPDAARSLRTTSLGIDGMEVARSEEHTSELQSLAYLVCRLLLEKKKKRMRISSCPSTSARI